MGFIIVDGTGKNKRAPTSGLIHPPGTLTGDSAAVGSLTPENLASLMAAYFFVKFRKFLVRNSVIYDIIRLYHLS